MNDLKGLGRFYKLMFFLKGFGVFLLCKKLMLFPKISGECLENNKIKNPTVMVHGTVGSTSTVAVENSRFGVFIKETVKTCVAFFLSIQERH